MAVIKMIKNPPKSRRSLRAAINYIKQPAKTRPDLVGGKDCDWELAFHDFSEVKAKFQKEDGIQAKHMVMSFGVDDNVSVELAKQLADELLTDKVFDGFQVLYAVHQDRDHIHTHFLINSVNMETGKRWHQTAVDLRNIKQHSNELCRQYGLSEIEIRKEEGSMSPAEYHNRFESWKYELYLTAVNTAHRSASQEDFTRIMQTLGYGVKWENDKKYITFTTPDGKKCRNRKMYPRYKFTKEALEKQFNSNAKNFGAEELKVAQERFISMVHKAADKKYPLSHLVEQEEAAVNLEGMQYQDWYENNREFMLDDDKYDTYKSLGYAMKYAVSSEDFVTRLNKMGMDAVLDTKSDVSVFVSKQGVEYDSTELYQGENYTPSALNECFARNAEIKNFKDAFWKSIKGGIDIEIFNEDRSWYTVKSKLQEAFQNNLAEEGYILERENQEYTFRSVDGKVIDTEQLNMDFTELFRRNQISTFLMYHKWTTENLEEFLASLEENGCEIKQLGDEITYCIDGQEYKSKNLNAGELEKYFAHKAEVRRCRDAIWKAMKSGMNMEKFNANSSWDAVSQALGKKSFEKALAKEGYTLEYETHEYTLRDNDGNITDTRTVDKYTFIDKDGKALNSDELRINLDEMLKENSIVTFLLYHKWTAESFEDFLRALQEDGCIIRRLDSEITYIVDGQEYTDEQFNASELEEYFGMRQDRHELRDVLWQVSHCATSKEDFIEKMSELDYTVHWSDEEGIEFIVPSGRRFVNKDYIELHDEEDIQQYILEDEELTSAALEECFEQNIINNRFDMLCNMMHIMRNHEIAPLTSANIGRDLTGEKLRDFLYHFEKGGASRYNKNLDHDMSM